MDGEGLRTLLSERTLVFDGGMGASLIERGASTDACLEAWNVDDPVTVQAVHRAFVAAGADVVVTNTFGANRFRLDRHGFSARVGELCRAGVAAARAAEPEIVAGSLGPLGVRLAPYGRVRPEQAVQAYAEQASALAEAGVDLLIVETQTDISEMEHALAAARDAAPGLAVVVSATFTRDDRTLLGSPPEEVAVRLADLGADAIGVNCGEGPAQALRLTRAIGPRAGSVPLVVRPNAGGPRQVGGRFVYPATPGYVADHARALVDEGVVAVGGCCGIGPQHLRAIREALANGHARAVDVVDRSSGEPEPDVPAPTAPTALQGKLARGEFVVAVEVEPPRSSGASRMLAGAQTLADAGADVIDVADSPMAKMRMSPWAACRLIQEHVGIETVLHFPTRGRNLLRIQGDLLAVHALGVRNLFVCVGDPITIGDYPHGTDNVDVTATGLLELVTASFNAGRDRAGASIGEPTSFFSGAAVNPSAPDLDRECRLLQRKMRAGAGFVLSQPLFSIAPLRTLRTTYARVAGEELTVPILAGVLPLVTARHAEFLHNEVPGIVVPDEVRRRLGAAGADAWREGVAMAADLVHELASEASGIYLMPQFGRVDIAADVVEWARRTT